MPVGTISSHNTLPDFNGRRNFLKLGALFVAGLPLAPSEVTARGLAQVVKIEAGELATILGYTGATIEELSRTAERDIRMNILNALTYKDWLQRTRTAKVQKGCLGYVDDLLELAAYRIRGKTDPEEISNMLKDIENFGKGIKSARLATLIAAATIANYSIKIEDVDGNPITSLEKLSKQITEKLNSKYKTLDLEGKILAENVMLLEIYGKEVVDNLLEMLPVSTNYESNALKDFVRKIDKLKPEDRKSKLNLQPIT